MGKSLSEVSSLIGADQVVVGFKESLPGNAKLFTTPPFTQLHNHFRA